MTLNAAQMLTADAAAAADPDYQDHLLALAIRDRVTLVGGDTYTLSELTSARIAEGNSVYYGFYGMGYPYPATRDLLADRVPRSTYPMVIGPDNRVNGLARLAPWRHGGPDVGELGRLAVGTQGIKMGAALLKRRIMIAPDLGYTILCSEAVGVPGCKSQLNLLENGLRFCGIQPLQYRNLLSDTLHDHPMSTVLMVMDLVPPRQLRTYSPERWQLPSDHYDDTSVSRHPWPGVIERPGSTKDGVTTASLEYVPWNWPYSAIYLSRLESQGWRRSTKQYGFGRIKGTKETFDYVGMYFYPGRLPEEDIHVAPAFKEDLKRLLADQRFST